MALDQGTTSSRAILYDRQARPLARAQVEFPQIYPQSGWVEHDPYDILSSQFRAASECVANAGISPADIAAVGITNQRETAIVWDRETGRPVCNAIVWQCRRSAQICDRLVAEGHAEALTERTGLVVDAYFSATKVRWMMENVPGVDEAARAGRLAFGTVDTWLIWNLTRGSVHATDVTNASRTLLMNLDERKWDPVLCALLDIPISLLPEIHPSSGYFGEIASGVRGMEAFAGIPIAGIAGDQHAALFGQGCLAPGSAKNTYGTGCFMLMNTGGHRVKSTHRLLSTIAWETASGVRYALEGSVFNAGSAIQWLRDELGLIRTASECDRLAETVVDTGGVYFVSAFTGLGAPHWDMYARG
ncbi:MAG TPA: glycerol kinase GlpK, partial [Clostridia bacterium]